ncbi:hypothetical protein [Caulobacter endophyticus]|uniref:hypothetical protein n=1 Tax=Caulobacter endophyticus TaxID=2172652 RepID=UPI00240F53FC|nr:hypothetical protein [Caulobacter endophyticus]MDG2528118.1 hypothetical protein [Caulobacter endophyticus]
MGPTPSIDPAEAVHMLAKVKAVSTDLARRARAPIWYHPALGLLMGGLVAVQGQAFPLMIGYYLAFLLGLALLVRAYKRHTGMWVSGYRAGRTRWVAVGLAVLTALSILLSAWLARDHALAAAPFVIGAIAASAVTIGGFVWEAAFRRDLRDGVNL